MIRNGHNHIGLYGHRILLIGVLCLFGISLMVFAADNNRKRKKQGKDERIYLVHADELKYDMYGNNPDAQIVKGKVSFSHQGSTLTCDSAFFFQESNSVQAFGHVRFRQGDTLSLDCERAYYDGVEQMMRARKNVVLKHRKQTLYTDSLDYDRLYSTAYFFEGGRLVDGNDKLVSDWGEYNTETRKASFYYNVQMNSGEKKVLTDTLHYDTRTSVAHVVGPSTVVSETTTMNTNDGFFNTKTEQAQMYGRSTIVDQQKTISGDSLFYDDETGISEGFGNVVYIDQENHNELDCGYLMYNQLTGNGYATKNALAKEFSQGDTLFVHADTLKLYTFNINTDSVYRRVHCYNKVRAYRPDMQAVCDSLVFNSLDSCMTMYDNPIVWYGERQLFGEVIKVYMNDSTIRMAHVIGQAFSAEKCDERRHFNQCSSNEMQAFFENGFVRYGIATGNVRAAFYPVDDKDSTLMAMNYAEMDTMRIFFSKERELEHIWGSHPKNGTWYPITQIPPSRQFLPQFAWFERIRPISRDDVFVWRGKSEAEKLKIVERHAAPLQKFGEAVKPENGDE